MKSGQIQSYFWSVFSVISVIKLVLRYPNKNLDQPFVLATLSTEKAATGINCITLHSAFHLPGKSGLKSQEYKKPSDKTFCMLRNNY